MLVLGIDTSHIAHKALDKYPTIHHFVTEMCTHVHISATKWRIVVMGLVHCGICATGPLCGFSLFLYNIPGKRSHARSVHSLKLSIHHGLGFELLCRG